MARGGKLSLMETTAPEDIIETNEEVGSLPFFLIDDEYGISECDCDLALVTKKKASKTGKVENGENPNKVYTYYKWIEIKYNSTFAGILETYLKEKKLNKFKDMKRTNDTKEIIKIEKELSDYIHNMLDIKTNQQFKEVCDLTDTILYLKRQIAEANTVLADYKKLVADTEKEFKESKKIIVENMPKQHKHKEVQEEEAIG